MDLATATSSRLELRWELHTRLIPKVNSLLFVTIDIWKGPSPLNAWNSRKQCSNAHPPVQWYTAEFNFSPRLHVLILHTVRCTVVWKASYKLKVEISQIHKRKNIKARKVQTYNRVVQRTACTSWYHCIDMIPPYCDRHSVSHFELSIIASWSEKDWKCQQFLTVVLQTKIQLLETRHHNLGIGGGVILRVLRMHMRSFKAIAIHQFKAQSSSHDSLHNVNEYWIYLSRT